MSEDGWEGWERECLGTSSLSGAFTAIPLLIRTLPGVPELCRNLRALFGTSKNRKWTPDAFDRTYGPYGVWDGLGFKMVVYAKLVPYFTAVRTLGKELQVRSCVPHSTACESSREPRACLNSLLSQKNLLPEATPPLVSTGNILKGNWFHGYSLRDFL